MRLPLAALGFTATIAQIVLMRELVAVFYGNELLFGLVLAAWLAWVAAGAWGLARLAPFRRMGARGYAAGLVLGGLLLIGEIALVRGVRLLLDVPPGAYVEFGPMVGVTALVLAPLCLLGGLLFTVGARLMVAEGGTAGGVCGGGGGGGGGGGILFSFVLIRWLDPCQTALLVLAVNLSVALSLYLSTSSLAPRSPRRLVPLIIGLFLLLIWLFIPFGRALHQATLGWGWPNLVFAADSPYGRITIQAWDGQRAFFENGFLTFETQGTFPEEVVHIPLLAHPDPDEVLLIGGGVAGDLREILKHPVTQVTYVELDPTLIAGAREHLPPTDAAFLDDVRVRTVLQDGRLYVKNTDQRFDVVLLDLPEPATGALNRFYTAEFFAEVRTILRPDGILALGLPSADNYWNPELARRNASVYHTLRKVYPAVVVLPGEHNFFLASERSVETDPVSLSDRLVGREVETRWVNSGYIDYIFTTDRFFGVREELEVMMNVRLNQDLRPICYYYDLSLWLTRMYPSKTGGGVPVLREIFERASFLNLWLSILPLVAIVLLARWRRKWALPVLIASVGLAQMTVEVVILFAFQVLHGYVYAEVSLIVTAFMAGLALGGLAANRWLAGGAGMARNPRRIRSILLAELVAIVIYALAFPLILRASIPAPALVFPLLALVAGFLTGMGFPLIVALTGGEVSQTAGMLYGADLLGGCLGALLGAIFLVPILGIPQTCLMVALFGVVGVLALV